mmetsp:Transcript_14442/g.14050  ORF Transcript_14442/g.14050 Transcript_14442/m.14050 type:complete len:204 (-) Transcript_14442:657-1268(-)
MIRDSMFLRVLSCLPWGSSWSCSSSEWKSWSAMRMDSSMWSMTFSQTYLASSPIFSSSLSWTLLRRSRVLCLVRCQWNSGVSLRQMKVLRMGRISDRFFSCASFSSSLELLTEWRIPWTAWGMVDEVCTCSCCEFEVCSCWKARCWILSRKLSESARSTSRMRCVMNSLCSSKGCSWIVSAQFLMILITYRICLMGVSSWCSM